MVVRSRLMIVRVLCSQPIMHAPSVRGGYHFAPSYIIRTYRSSTHYGTTHQRSHQHHRAPGGGSDKKTRRSLLLLGVVTINSSSSSS